MYFCPSFIARIVDEEANGLNAREIWDEWRCNEWTASEVVYMDVDGNIGDRGDMDGEQCETHHQGYWEDNISNEAYQTLIAAGWTPCLNCEADGADRRDAPLFNSGIHQAEHDRTEHGERPTVNLEPPVAAVLQGPPQPRITLDDLPAFPTMGDALWPRPQPAVGLARRWHSDIPVADATYEALDRHFRLIGITDPVGYYYGAYIRNNNPAEFSLIRSSRSVRETTDYTAIRFVHEPPRPRARSTEGMWAS